MLLVDDHQPDVGERGEDGQPGPDDDIDLAGPDPAPLVGPLARPDRRVDERHPRVEVGPEPVDERHREGDLGDEHEHRPAAFERGGDRLDVDRRLAPARHAVEQERRRISSLEGRADRADGLRLRLGQRRRHWPSAPDAGRPSPERATWSFADVDRGQSTPDEAGQRRRPVAARQRSRGQPGRRSGHELLEQVTLAGTERPSRLSLACLEGLDDRTSIVGGGCPALIAWATGRGEQGPVEVDQAASGEVPQPSGEADPALRRRKVADRQRPGPELVEEGPIGVIDRSRALVRGRGPIGPQLGDELEPLEDPRREHRPKHDGGRREIRLGDPPGQGKGQRREQRTVGADPIGDRLRLQARSRGGRSEHDPERLPPAEFDQDGLTRLEVHQSLGDRVREAPASRTGRVDGHLDETSGGRPGPGDRQAEGRLGRAADAGRGHRVHCRRTPVPACPARMVRRRPVGPGGPGAPDPGSARFAPRSPRPHRRGSRRCSRSPPGEPARSPRCAGAARARRRSPSPVT